MEDLEFIDHYNILQFYRKYYCDQILYEWNINFVEMVWQLAEGGAEIPDVQ
jgi:hypothetical protein